MTMFPVPLRESPCARLLPRLVANIGSQYESFTRSHAECSSCKFAAPPPPPYLCLRDFPFKHSIKAFMPSVVFMTSCLCSKMHGAINQSGAIAGLVKVLDSGCTQAQHNAIEAIRNLSVDPAACRQIQQANQVIPICSLAFHQIMEYIRC